MKSSMRMLRRQLCNLLQNSQLRNGNHHTLSESQPASRNTRHSSVRWAVASGAAGLAIGTINIPPHESLFGQPGKFWAKKSTRLNAVPEYADRETMLKAITLIEKALGQDSISLDEDMIQQHGYSDWSTSNCFPRPLAVAMPRSTEEVSQIARICSEHKVPMIPFGAGSSVEGNFSAPFSGISVDLSLMDQIVAFHPDDLNVVVQPGVNWVDLNEKVLKKAGLFLPLDPSPTASVGGMVATNCSGTNAVRYGTMKDWVVNLTVVLADGRVIKTRHRPRKSSAGYNLNSLFTGSEGTLGFITEITLKLATIPEKYSVATTTFPSVRAAASAASQMLRQAIPLAAVELMDDVQMRVINMNGGAGGKTWEEKPTLFLKFSGTQRSIEDDISRVKLIAQKYGGSSFEFAKTEQEKHNLWSARKEALWAMMALKPEGYQMWSTDVAVPISRMAELIEISKQESGSLGLFSTVLGHVGDGNFHQAVMYDPNDPMQKNGVKQCVDLMMKRAVEMEGTVSGEHGIGLGKKECLLKELGEETIDVMRSLKRSLDPHCLMNPGKIFD